METNYVHNKYVIVVSITIISVLITKFSDVFLQDLTAIFTMLGYFTNADVSKINDAYVCQLQAFAFDVKNT